jgi:hypothetical protein
MIEIQHEVNSMVAARFSENERTARESLDALVQELIASSSSEVVANALTTALKQTILKVRHATREEMKSGDGVVVFRNAGPKE